MRAKFEREGGRVLEFAAAEGAEVRDNGVTLRIPTASRDGRPPQQNGASGAEEVITGRLLIDCMGNFSPIVRQVPMFSESETWNSGLLSADYALKGYCFWHLVNTSAGV